MEKNDVKRNNNIFKLNIKLYQNKIIRLIKTYII